MFIQKAILSVAAIGLFATLGFAQDNKDEKVDERYRAFSVSMTQGVSGVLEYHITRWTTPEERQALANTLVEQGQKEFVDALRKQKETGFTRTQTGRGMRGWPSTRIHYAYQFPEPDGKRVVVLVTDRSMSMAEAARGGKSTDYEVSALIMELEKGDDGKEQGQGTLYLAAKLGYDKEKKKLEIESLGAQPIRLTDIKREK